jgi:hypothetical protein
MSKARNIADLGSNDVLDTTASGISITGEVASDTLTINGGTNFTSPTEFMGNDTFWAVAVQNGTTANASYGLVIRAGTSGTDASLEVRDADNNKALKIVGNGDIVMYKDDGTTAGVTFDASTGDFLVGTTDSTPVGSGSNGTAIGNGIIESLKYKGASLKLDRYGDSNNSNDGSIIEFYSGSSGQVGSIGVDVGDLTIYSTTASHAGLKFGNTVILPTDNSGSNADNAISLGVAGTRFKDLYLSGGLPGTAGGELVINDGGVDSDFRVESANLQAALFIQGSDGNVGIGTSLPAAPLEVQNPVTNTSLAIFQNSRTRALGNIYGIEFRDNSNEANANIVVNQQSSGNNASYVDFYVNKGTGGTGLQNGVKALTLSGTQNTFNEDGGDVDFRVESNNNSNMLFVDASANYVNFGTNATDIGSSSSGEGVTYRNGESLRIQRASGDPLIVNRVTDDGSIIAVRKNGAGIGYIGSDGGKMTVNSSGSNLVFQTGGTSRVNIDSTQMYPQTDGAMSLGHPSVRWNNLRLSGEIKFDSSSAGLDAYEEGTWTAYISDINGNNPVSGGTMGYVRIGSVMYLFGQAAFVNVNAYIGGSQAYLHTPTAPRNAFAQSSNDVLIPFWHSGTAASLDYWNGGYPSISINTGSTRHPIFRHKYNGADAISGANLGSGDLRVNFNGFFYYE